MSKNLEMIHGEAVQDWNFVASAIQGTYFGVGRSKDEIINCCRASKCFGVRDKDLGQQVAFARIVTDGVIYSYLADVVVHPMMRGQGIGKFLIQAIIEDPALRRTNINLCTRDPSFYQKLGFQEGQQFFLRARK